MSAVAEMPSEVTDVNYPNNYQLVSTVSLSQDVVISSQVVADTQSINPLACFPNPGKQDGLGNNLVEALALVTGESGTSLVWVQRAAVETGWQTVAFTGLATTPVEIAAGLAIDGNPVAFYSDGQQFYWMSLDVTSQTWSAPAVLYTSAVSNIAVAYNNSNVLIAYGQTSDDNLVIAQPSGSTFNAREYVIGGALAGAKDFVVCNDTSNGWWVGIADGASGQTYGGTLGQAGYSTNGTMPALPDGGTVSSVKFGYFMQGSLVFVITDSNGNAYSVYGDTATQVNVSGTTTLSNVTGQVSMPGSAECVSLFATDSDNNLWVMNTPSASPFDKDTGPNWVPWIPLDTGVGAVVGDMSIGGGASIFTLDAAVGAVGLWAKDPVSSQWRSNPILQGGGSAQTAYEVTRYRAEFSVMNNGVVAPGLDATLALGAGSSTTEVSIGGQPYLLTNGGDPIPVQTDANGKVTVAILVTQTLTAPSLVLTVGGTALPACQVNGDIKSYLSGGTTPLNPTNPANAPQTLDSSGSALINAKTSSGASLLSNTVQQNTTLVQAAASGIMQVAAINPGQSSASLVKGGPVGFAFSLRRDAPEFRTLHTREEFEAWHRAHAPGETLDSIWDDIEDFAGDIYQGIKNGLIAVENAAVDVENSVVKLTVTIANAVTQAVSLTLTAIDDVINLVSGVFQAIEAAVEDVIDWLKALFDFAAIWNTATWIEAAISQGLTTVQGFLNGIDTSSQSWFSDQYDTISGNFTTLAGQSVASNAMQKASNYSAPGQPPATPMPGSSGATTGSLSNNVHHNWLQDKVTAGGAPSLALPDSGMDTAYDNFITALEAAGDTLADDIGTLFTWFQDQLTGNSSFGGLTISTVIGAFEQLLKDLLAFADAMLATAVALLADATGLLASSMTATLDLGPINTLWAWIVEAAGQSAADNPLTIAALVALVIAFPTTIAWKLTNGVDTAPFPGTTPWANNDTVSAVEDAAAGTFKGDRITALEDDTPSINTTFEAVAQFIRIISGLPNMITDAAGPAAPPFFRYIRSGCAIAAFACGTGLPTEEDFLDWAEANPGQAANILADAIWPAIGVIGAYKTLSFATSRKLMGVLSTLNLAWNIYKIVDEGESDVDSIIFDVTWPLPNIINMFFPNGFASEGDLGALFAAINGMIYFFDPILELIDESSS